MPESIRVFFDTHAFREQRFGGISRYFAELIRRLPAENVTPILHLPWIDNAHAAQVGLSTNRGAKAVASIPLLRQSIYALWATHDRMRVLRGDYDLFHRTHYARFCPTRRPRVCTVHDMIPEIFPQHFRDGNPHRGKREAVEVSDLVFSDSESTTNDLVRVFGVPRQRVVTVPLGIDRAAFADAPTVAHPFRKPYLLFVGLRGRYKNFARLSVALANVLRGRGELSLALVGGGPLSPDESQVFAQAGVLSRVTQAGVSEAALPSIYRDAELFIFPSEYEGFGLPLLESFACGCPVAASRASSFPEVGGDAIEYFDPTAIDDMQSAIERVLGSSSRAEELRRLGKQRAEIFTWERTAQRTAEVYRRLL